MRTIIAACFVVIAPTALAQFSFGEVEAIFITGDPYGFTVSDFNNDGTPDTAVSVDNPDKVEVYANNGAGEFIQVGASLFLGTGLGPRDIVHADFDMDGDKDLAVALSRFDLVRILTNDGSGNFSFGQLATTGLFPTKLSAGRIDADEDPDLVVLNRDSGTVSVELNQGGSFSENPYPVGLEPRDVELGDFDGDGDLDFATANLLSASLTVWYNDGQGSFSGRLDLPTIAPFLPYDVDTKDIDADGDADIVAAGWGDNGQNNRVYGVNVFRSNGAGFGAPVFYSLRLWAGFEHEALTMGDFDSDGDFDILGGAVQGALDFLVNGGNGTFSPGYEDYGGNPLTEMQSVDLNGDLKVDTVMTHLVSGGGIGAHVDYFINTTPGNWSQFAPTSHDVQPGRQISGNIGSLASSDNEYLALNPGVVLTSNQPPVVLTVEATSPLQSPSRLMFGAELHVGLPRIMRRVHVFNFAQNSWDEIDAQHALRGDEMTWFDLPSRDYVQTGTRSVRARITFKPSGPTLIYPWTVRIDRVAWAVR